MLLILIPKPIGFLQLLTMRDRPQASHASHFSVDGFRDDQEVGSSLFLVLKSGSSVFSCTGSSIVDFSMVDFGAFVGSFGFAMLPSKYSCVPQVCAAIKTLSLKEAKFDPSNWALSRNAGRFVEFTVGDDICVCSSEAFGQ